MRLAGSGVEVTVPAGWDARVYTRPLAAPALMPNPPLDPFHRDVQARGGTASLHAASFALPADDGDFGTGATAEMSPSGTFVALLEYQAGGGLEPGKGLYAGRPPASLAPDDFDPRALLRALPGQLGAQRFFTASGRPFCLYAVIGSEAFSRRLVELNELVSSLWFSPALG
jgi:hypothetical protein